MYKTFLILFTNNKPFVFLKIFVDWMMSSITHDALCVIVARYLLVIIHIQMLFTGLLSIIHINDYTAIQMDKNALKS